MLTLIWIQTVWHSDSVPKGFFFKKLTLEQISRQQKKHEKIPSMQRVKVITQLISDKYRVPVKAWGQGINVGSDTDSASGSSKSLDSSPSNSPYPSGHKKMGLSGSMEDLIEVEVPPGVKNLLAVPGTESLDVQSIMKVSILP